MFGAISPLLAEHLEAFQILCFEAEWRAAQIPIAAARTSHRPGPGREALLRHPTKKALSPLPAPSMKLCHLKQ